VYVPRCGNYATIGGPSMQCPSCQTPVDDSQRFCPACGTVIATAPAGQPTSDPLIGQILGAKYKVVRLIGEGGMGAVYEGEQSLGTAKRKVAIKTLHPHLSRDAKIKARFEREVGTIAELEHPNTIQVYDFGSTPEGILYIVMEFLQGKSLADVIEKEGALPPGRAENILRQVCGSLEEAHARGIVHRDLKPDNVVLVERAGKKDFVKVLDFGIAKRSKEEDKEEQKLTQQGMVLGTPPYMSPEQFTGRPIDLRSDIYSLGVMAYEMLSGKLPFKADTAWEWATQHMTQPPVPLESLPEAAAASAAMRAALRRALAKSPEERFQSVSEFMDAFSGTAGDGARSATVAAPMVGSAASGRQKTELGTPLDVGAAFGAPALQAGPPSPLGSAPVQGYTPVAGNVSFPTPAGIPQPPPRGGKGGDGGNRKGLLLAAGLIGLASVVAIVMAVRGSGGNKAVVFDNATTIAPATSLSAAPVPTEATPPADTTAAAEIPPLNGASEPRPSPHAGTGPAHAQAPSPGSPAPATPAKPKYDGPECQRARTLKAIGHSKEAQSWQLACIAKGGNPN
ncbi:MAG: protein kinase domain-containing protein, partial [Polyangiaceae bacterium]